MRSLFASASALVVGLITAPALVLAGPGAPAAQASVIDLTRPALPLTVPGSVLAGQGASAATVSAALADTAGSAAVVTAGGGTPVVAGAGVAGGGAAAAALTSPLVVAAGGLAIGFGIGHFGAQIACNGGATILCMPKKAEFVPNADIGGLGDVGWLSGQTGIAGAVGYNGLPIHTPNVVAWGWTASEPIAWHSADPDLAFNVTYEATAHYSTNVNFSMRWYCQPDAGGSVVQLGGSQFAYLGGSGFGEPGTHYVMTLGCGPGSTFDSARIIFPATEAESDGSVTTWTGGSWYYPVGHPERPPDLDTDPLRHWLTRGTCVEGGGVDIVEEISASFQETDDALPKYPDVECASGSMLTHLEVQKITPTLDPQTVWEWDPPPGYSDFPTDYPDCIPTAGHHCQLILSSIDETTGTRLSCFAHPRLCLKWWGHVDDDPATYECKYGTHVVSLDECAVYRRTFKHNADVEAGTTTDADPGPYSDPDPTVEEDPGPGDDETSCPPDAGFLAFLNPFWLFETMKCAFVPRGSALQAGWDAANVDWCETAPGVMACGVSAVMAPWTELGNGDTSGCLGAPVDIPVLRPGHVTPDDDPRIYPFQACETVTHTLSLFWLGISSASLYLASLLLGAKILGKTIGAGDVTPA